MASNYELVSSEPLQPQQSSSQAKVSTWKTFKHHIPHIVITVLIDMIIPLLLCFALQHRIKAVYALLIASSPPLLMVIFRAITARSFDAIGFIFFVGFVLSAIVALVLNSAIILLFEKSLLTGIGALVFALTLIPFRCCSNRCRWRPMVYYFYYDLIPITREEYGLPDSMFDNDEYTELQDDDKKQKLARTKEVARLYAWIYDHCPSFRISCYFMTGVWAVAFAVESIVRCVLISVHASVSAIYIIEQILFTILVILCAILQICSMAIERKHTFAYIEQWKIENLNVHQSHPHSLSNSYTNDNGTIVKHTESVE